MAGNPETLIHFEGVLHGVCTVILQQDIERAYFLYGYSDQMLRLLTPVTPEFVPYTFQILSQLLELHPQSSTSTSTNASTSPPLPSGYRALLPLLLTPAPWAQKGSIPGLVRFICASLARDAVEIARAGQVGAVLAVAQQRLIPSRVNDGWGFELLEGVVRSVPLYEPSYFQVLLW